MRMFTNRAIGWVHCLNPLEDRGVVVIQRCAADGVDCGLEVVHVCGLGVGGRTACHGLMADFSFPFLVFTSFAL